MARPIKHDGGLYQRAGSAVWWMQYRDKAGKRQRESTGTADWDEAQKKLRERLQARDNNSLASLRRGSVRNFGIRTPKQNRDDPHYQRAYDRNRNSSGVMILRDGRRAFPGCNHRQNRHPEDIKRQ